eukprot:GCRY01005332.1.p1 GENE.GCRY01005332.1~~GCRY01005332.1.p1  ORF type:complete len:282 (+),score=24.94 GCRY01005332.1:74-847(+)
MNIDPAVANELARIGGTFLCLNVPQGIEFGIDTRLWETGPRFKGVKMIPPGIHFIHYRVLDQVGNMSPKSGFFQDFSQGQVVVRKWDSSVEDFLPESHLNQEDYQRFQEGVRRFDFDRELAPYALDYFEEWQHLSSFITRPLFQKIENQGFTDFAFQVPKGLSGEALSHARLDGSATLIQLLRTAYSNDETLLLGEIQYAFILLLYSEMLEGLEQWKASIALMCSVETALPQHTRLFEQLCALLYFQLKKSSGIIFS